MTAKSTALGVWAQTYKFHIIAGLSQNVRGQEISHLRWTDWGQGCGYGLRSEGGRGAPHNLVSMSGLSDRSTRSSIDSTHGKHDLARLHNSVLRELDCSLHRGLTRPRYPIVCAMW